MVKMINNIKKLLSLILFGETYQYTYTIGRRKVNLIKEYDEEVDFGEYKRTYHKYLYSLESEYNDECIIHDTVTKIKEPVVLIVMKGLHN